MADTINVVEEKETTRLPDDVINNINFICGAIGRPLTEEQMRFASNFIEPTMSFADAGTGKTMAVAVGLVHTQTYHKISGSKIGVISFTREAAREISDRYDLMGKYKFLTTRCQFSTFHSLCWSILTDAWGMPTIQDFSYTKDLDALRNLVEGQGVTGVSNAWLKQFIGAMNSLNSAFIFDPDEMEKTYKFKKLEISATIFNQVRKRWFLRQISLKTIPRGDIPLHCYNLLMRNKKIRDKYHNMFKILCVDEFQDMSVLYVKIIKELCEIPIVIGDMKQQIYAFNGASDSIVREFLSSYPDARICPLTQSFRCKDEIVDYAMKLVEPNKPVSYGFKGLGSGGKVNVIRNRELPIEEIAESIYEYQRNIETVEKKDIMFLFRNNFSGMAIMEKLYQKGVRFRSSKFKKVMDLPIFDDMCVLLDACEDGTDTDKVWKALQLFEEYKFTRRDNCALLPLIEQTKKQWIDINYSYKTSALHTAVEVLKVCRQGIKDGRMAGQLFMTLLPLYDEFIIKGNWWWFEMSKEFYMNLVAPIANTKTYGQMRAEEFDKENKNDEAMAHYDGVRCYTIHSAKGLEADVVYVIDCDEGIIPSKKNIDNYVKSKCTYEAARLLRNERNLMYVAATRARNELNICYTSELAHLISSPFDNEYSYLDEVYENDCHEYYNLEHFMILYNYEEVA